MKWFLVFCCINLLTNVSTEKSNSNTEDKAKSTKSEEDVFIPTHEWKIVKKGQSIPKGLHVRINLETGLTEAKLLEEELKVDEKKNSLLSVPQPDKQEEDKQENASNSKLKLEDALKNIKNEDLSESDEEMIQRVTKKFKKYEEIKKEFEGVNLSVKTDAEVLKELFTKHNKVISNKQFDSNTKNLYINNILEDMEYLVHQIDNANEFINLKGFENVVYKYLNSSNTKIKCQAINILGSSAQNNPKVQIHALETGSIDKLLRILALDNNNQVLSRTLYAIGSILRRFPLAQQQFVRNGGLSVFSQIFENPQKIKIQIRIITLLYDLLTEHDNAIKNVDTPDYNERIKQYNNINLRNKLQELKWCEIFSNVLKDILNFDQNNHDSVEKCLSIMCLVQDICLTSYNSTEVKKMIKELYNKYLKLSLDEIKENSSDPDSTNHTFYFIKMKELTDSLVKSLNILDKTEL